MDISLDQLEEARQQAQQIATQLNTELRNGIIGNPRLRIASSTPCLKGAVEDLHEQVRKNPDRFRGGTFGSVWFDTTLSGQQ